ncbi:alpha/beta hydrolase [Streptomyces sp. NPDC048297]|uniref:alpha/beta hydrolase n=1 Tax=Streptomyces sp. NPDC048297 TaxID=3365531 RepID=UPI003716AF91
MTRTSPARTIVLIHGLWMTPRSWERWTERYQSLGHRVIAPAWPGLEGEVEEIRRDPSRVAGLGLGEVVAHYEQIIRGLDEAPVLMGHSFGGAITQILLDRGLGSAGVAIDSAPVKGVLPLPYTTLKSAWPVLGNPANKNKAISLTPRQFHYAFTNTLSEEESAAAYERYQVPGSARMLFQGAFANVNPRAVTKVDPRNPRRAPLLFIAGGADHIVPPKLNKANVRLYRKSPAVTEYREFPGRSHFIVGQDGWEEVADHALDWAVRHQPGLV